MSSRQVLADRLVTYSDTLAAFALVNGLAFVITLGEPDIRCSIASVSPVLYAINLLAPVIGTWSLFWLRDYRNQLLVPPEATEAVGDGARDGPGAGNVDSASADATLPAESAPVRDEVVERFWRIAFWVRIGLIWIFALIVIVGVYGATRDPRCASMVG